MPYRVLEEASQLRRDWRTAAAAPQRDGKMKGICRSYVMAWLLAVATIVEADAQTDTYPSKPVQIIAIRRPAAPQTWPCDLLPIG